MLNHRAFRLPTTKVLCQWQRRIRGAVVPFSTESQQHIDAFRTFDLPYTFDIDMDALKHSYRNLMAQHHPDRNTGGDDMAATVTLSYDLLRHGHSRATHLLERLGHPLDESSTGDLVGTEFLMELMKIRERLEEATSDEALLLLREENDTNREKTCRALSVAIDSTDIGEAMKQAAQLQYWNRIDERILEKRDDVDE